MKAIPTLGPRRFAFRVWAVVAVLVLCGTLWAFRTKSLSTFYGEVTVRYKWGRVSQVEFDFDRDGAVDCWADWPAFEEGYVPPREWWAVVKSEGGSRYHAIYAGGALAALEVDRDGDGEYEQVLRGADAERLIARLQEIVQSVHRPREGDQGEPDQRH